MAKQIKDRCVFIYFTIASPRDLSVCADIRLFVRQYRDDCGCGRGQIDDRDTRPECAAADRQRMLLNAQRDSPAFRVL